VGFIVPIPKQIKKIILSENPMQFFEIYGDIICLTREELKEYIKSQEQWKRKGQKEEALDSC